MEMDKNSEEANPKGDNNNNITEVIIFNIHCRYSEKFEKTSFCNEITRDQRQFPKLSYINSVIIRYIYITSQLKEK